MEHDEDKQETVGMKNNENTKGNNNQMTPPLNTGIVIAIIISTLAFIVLLLILIRLCVKKRVREQKSVQSSTYEMYSEIDQSTIVLDVDGRGARLSRRAQSMNKRLTNIKPDGEYNKLGETNGRSTVILTQYDHIPKSGVWETSGNKDPTVKAGQSGQTPAANNIQQNNNKTDKDADEQEEDSRHYFILEPDTIYKKESESDKIATLPALTDNATLECQDTQDKDTSLHNYVTIEHI